MNKFNTCLSFDSQINTVKRLSSVEFIHVRPIVNGEFKEIQEVGFLESKQCWAVIYRLHRQKVT